jgi:hypothetical protein
MEHNTHDQSLIALLRELRDETTTLVHQEIALAKAETTEKLISMGRQVAYIAGGIALGYTAIILLLLGIRDLLAQAFLSAGATAGVASAVSSFIVAALITAAGWALVSHARKALKGETLAPEKTIESVREDKEFIKQKLART